MTKSLTLEDFRWAAEALGCDLPAIRAVADVEAAGSGFLANGFPRILFESRWFDTLTARRFRDAHPDLSTPTWVRNYAGGAAEYERLGRAMLLARTDALKSTSWGLFQVLGANYLAVGYQSIEDMVRSMMHSERDHLDAMCKFVVHHKLDRALREQRWDNFAYGYNGPRYAENRYHEKLAAAYERYARDPEITQILDAGNGQQAITRIQKQLNAAGYDIQADGIQGPRTTSAIKAFQAAQRLPVDGLVGPRTRAALARVAGE